MQSLLPEIPGSNRVENENLNVILSNTEYASSQHWSEECYWPWGSSLLFLDDQKLHVTWMEARSFPYASPQVRFFVVQAQATCCKAIYLRSDVHQTCGRRVFLACGVQILLNAWIQNSSDLLCGLTWNVRIDTLTEDELLIGVVIVEKNAFQRCHEQSKRRDLAVHTNRVIRGTGLHQSVW